MRTLIFFCLSALLVTACGGETVRSSVKVGGACTSSAVCTAGVCLDGICRASCSATQSCPAGYDCTNGGCFPTKGPVCGDGQVDGTEACDDGNANSGDGCSSTCQLESGYVCSGQPSHCVPCTDPDPLNCTSTFAYTDWSDWSMCSAQCGAGTQTRTRSCQRSDGQTADCSHCGGDCSETQSCMLMACPSMYGPWSNWSTCMNGQITRTRTCQQGDITVDCANCGGDCSEAQMCPDCSMLSPNVVNCNPNVPGDPTACTTTLQMGKQRCLSAGCMWMGPDACTVGGSPSSTMCYGAMGTCY